MLSAFSNNLIVAKTDFLVILGYAPLPASYPLVSGMIVSDWLSTISIWELY
jgi:hypothetical protein